MGEITISTNQVVILQSPFIIRPEKRNPSWHELLKAFPYGLEPPKILLSDVELIKHRINLHARRKRAVNPFYAEGQIVANDARFPGEKRIEKYAKETIGTMNWLGKIKDSDHRCTRRRGSLPILELHESQDDIRPAAKLLGLFEVKLDDVPNSFTDRKSSGFTVTSSPDHTKSWERRLPL